MKTPISVQMFTLRDYTEKDFVGTLEKMAGIGFQGVEFAGFGGMKALELANVLKTLGLEPSGTHYTKEALKEDVDRKIEYDLEIGNRFLICSWDINDTRDGWLRSAELYNVVGEKCSKNGIQFCYHNHENEFVKYDGEYVLDMIYRETHPQYVKFEIDTYWAKYMDVDPAGVISKYRGRCPLIHFKDMEAGEEKTMTEVGSGILDFPGIAAASDGEAQWFIIEQDRCKRPAMDSVGISFENLKKMNLINVKER